MGKAKAPVAATHAPVVTVAAITPAYLDIKQAALFLGPTTGTISRLIENKDLVCAKIGKRFIVKREDLDMIWGKKAAEW
jgi:excisionase family DNA binding protein